MRFQHGGWTWRVKFHHTEDYKHNKVTKAILEKRQGADQSWLYVDEGQVVCYATDTYDRKLGNFLAFERLAKGVYFWALRTCMWNAYWATTGHPERVNLSVEGDLV